MGKWFLHASSFIFDRIIIKVAGNQDRHKNSDESDFGPDYSLWSYLPLNDEIFTWISLKPVGQSDQILCVASLEVGKGCIMFWGRLDQNSGVHGDRKLPLTLLHIKVRLPVQLCAVKMVQGDFRFCWTTTPNVGQTHKENPNLVRILYMVCTLNDI